MGMIEAFARGWVNARDRHSSDYPPASAGSGAPEPGISASLADELDECRQRLGELTGALEALTARAELLAAVLRLPGVRLILVKLVHPDRHPNASDEDKREFAEAAAKVNAAYQMLDGDPS